MRRSFASASRAAACGRSHGFSRVDELSTGVPFDSSVDVAVAITASARFDCSEQFALPHHATG